MRVHKMRYCSAATEAGSFKVTSLLSTRALFTRLSPCSITTGTPSSASRAVIFSSSILFLFNQLALIATTIPHLPSLYTRHRGQHRNPDKRINIIGFPERCINILQQEYKTCSAADPKCKTDKGYSFSIRLERLDRKICRVQYTELLTLLPFFKTLGKLGIKLLIQ